MSPKFKAHNNQNLMFLENFLVLYQDLMNHDGYSELNIKITQVNGKQKKVKLQCGREFTYTISRTSISTPNRYKIIDTIPHIYSGPERRCTQKRRLTTSRRRSNEPRNFRLERRVQNERRAGSGRRFDD